MDVQDILPDPTQRFANRVENYVRFRPKYPEKLLDILEKETGLTSSSIVADIGSGTGISAQLFLERGCTVYAVEPNNEMRKAAESLLKKYAGFRSVNGRAEDTTLESGSVDFVVAAQAFHWFDRPATQREFKRILKPGGWAVLMWNTRRIHSTPFQRDYEDILQRFGTDYQRVKHMNVGETDLTSFLGPFRKHVLLNAQSLNFEELKGRLLSSSYVPAEGDSKCEPMLNALAEIFERHSEGGRVQMDYDTEIYLSQFRPPVGLYRNAARAHSRRN